jgi:hypothetical protein
MTVDTSHYGGSNGSGGRFNDSVAQILTRNQLRAEAEAKAADDPSSLNETDLPHLAGETLSRLMSAGRLSHLGLGRRRTGRKH